MPMRRTLRLRPPQDARVYNLRKLTRFSLVNWGTVASEEKFGRLKQLMDSGKEKGYVLVRRSQRAADGGFPGGRELDDLLWRSRHRRRRDPRRAEARVRQEARRSRRARRPRTASRTSPTRPTIRCACTCARWARCRCSRAKAKSNWPSASSAARAAVRKALSRSPLVIREILRWRRRVAAGTRAAVRDVLVMPDLVVGRRGSSPNAPKNCSRAIAEIEKHYKKAQQFRQKLQAISRGMKPKHAPHAALEPGAHHGGDLAADPRHSIQFRTSRRPWPAACAQAVEELRPVEREIARIQRKLEASGQRAPCGATLRKELQAAQPAHPAAGRRIRRHRHRTAPHAADRRARRAGSRRSPRSS